MEHGCSSYRSWADQVEEEELTELTAASPGTSRLNPNVAPFPGAAGPSSLNPDAAPFYDSLAGSWANFGELLSFTDSEDSDSDAEAESPAADVRGKTPTQGAPHRRRVRGRRRRPRSEEGFMAAACCSHPAIDGPPEASRLDPSREDSRAPTRRLSPPVAHPARAHGMPDAEGFGAEPPSLEASVAAAPIPSGSTGAGR